MRLLIASAVVIAAALGCATGEAIDETHSSGGSGGVSGTSAGAAGFVSSGGNAGASNGGTANGGTGNEPGTGGALGGDGAGGATGGVGGATGGVGGATGGVGGGTGGSGGQQCAANQKSCGGVCVVPEPAYGCSLTDCTPCAVPPANSFSKCVGGLCDFECNGGYVKQGASCVLPGTGGTGGGTGGTGGGTGCPQPCDSSQGQDQFICTFLCVTQQKFGICAPGLNCCVCL